MVFYVARDIERGIEISGPHSLPQAFHATVGRSRGEERSGPEQQDPVSKGWEDRANWGGRGLRGYRVCIHVSFQESRFLKFMQTTKRVPSVFHVVYPLLFLSSHSPKNTHLNYHGFQLPSPISLHLSSSIQFTIKIRYAALFVCLFKEKLIGPTPKLTVMYLSVILLINNFLTKVRFQGCLCEHKQDRGQDQQTTTAC